LQKDKSQRTRIAFQLLFVIIPMYIIIVLVQNKLHSVHAYCPYAVVCFGTLLSRWAGNMALLFTAAIAVGLLICVITMFIGRKFCGYICPIGTIQDLLFKLRNRKYRLTKHLSFFYEYKFRRLIYIILGMTVVFVIMGKSSVYMRFCPVLTIGRLPSLALTGLIVWLIIILGSLLTSRFWCRFLCPYAALLNIFQYISKLFGFKRLLIKRNLETCIDCCYCIKNCPMNLNLQEGEYITDPNCIHCMICAASCPKANTIKEELTSKDCYE